jgi:hypothetical protein
MGGCYRKRNSLYETDLEQSTWLNLRKLSSYISLGSDGRCKPGWELAFVNMGSGNNRTKEQTKERGSNIMLA